MGRQTREKNKIQNRNEAFKHLREMNSLESHTDRRGNTVYLNPLKRFIKGKPYKFPEYQRIMKKSLKGAVDAANNLKKSHQEESDG